MIDLVTGAAGFLGSHLCDALLAKGHEVIGLDNFFTGSKDNIRHLHADDHFEMIRHDVIHPILLEADRIYNFACPASPLHYQFNPVKTIKTSVLGTINMLGLAKRVKARILQASTSEVYGDPEEHPQKESYWGRVNPIGPRSCYDEGKRVAESLLVNYQQQNHVDIRIVRIFNTYGPRMALNDGRVISNFILQALRGEPITIFGRGEQTRSFCYVSDLIDGTMRMMEQNEFSGPINLGNPEEITVLELAELVLRLTASRSKIVFQALPVDDPVRRKPDISLAREKLAWEIKVQLRDGLQKTIDYFKKTLSAGK
jgi:UDP-glucuronate decarboxylase